MATEYEIKILNIPINNIKEQLQQKWTFIKKQNFRRYVYDFTPAQKEKRIRLRTDGETTTLSCKHIINPHNIDWTKEWEILVNDFEKTNELLEQLWFFAKSYQENTRELYQFNGVEVSIDSRPHIPPYLEIEGNSIKEVQQTILSLQLENAEQTSENTTKIYEKYGFYNIDKIKILSFNHSLS